MYCSIAPPGGVVHLPQRVLPLLSRLQQGMHVAGVQSWPVQAVSMVVEQFGQGKPSARICRQERQAGKRSRSAIRRHDGPIAHFHVPERPGPSTTVRWLPLVASHDCSFHGLDVVTAIVSKCVGRNGPIYPNHCGGASQVGAGKVEADDVSYSQH